jgi:hypothetical protein
VDEVTILVIKTLAESFEQSAAKNLLPIEEYLRKMTVYLSTKCGSDIYDSPRGQ